ncbi:hypothetical protein COV23_00170 [Candidatus Wolfebacteria bacterium CG10_big_fil_rev_8_21_14_0_10_31_9]|uniref:Uncharacterized protein n=1 Tax=Candidatus Wolfebacteria bacterium CG10_big_fil_rev_8_21_14_0_10_31_9 TaxID=1975070 RepID=A0A2H0RD27_9BACT|nr:MAG: hypothetical protein COV23_00170 [Candidatus Wolfebacteria bacterium CG10_big_fil_rev_8_21_14_0_10_31_9]
MYKNQKAFTLVELMLYLGIFVIIGGLFFGVLTQIVRINSQETSGNEVTNQLNFTMQAINRLVKSSSNIEISAGSPTSTLKLRLTSSVSDPTCIYLSDNSILLAEGPDTLNPQNCTTDINKIKSLTTSKVIVDSLSFKKLTFYPGHDQVLVDIQMSSANSNPTSKIARTLHSAISRVSAATFDSDLLPGSATYNLGNSGSNKWNNIYVGNLLNLGQLSEDPACAANGSIYYNTNSNEFRGCVNGTWSSVGSSLWMATSTNMYSNVVGNVGVGIMSPNAKLDVATDGIIPIIYGSNNASGNLTLGSTKNTTKGKIFFGNSATTAYDETNNNFGIGTLPISNTLLNISTNKRYGINIDQTVTSGVYPAGMSFSFDTSVATQGIGQGFILISSGTTTPSDNLAGTSVLVQQRRAADTTGGNMLGSNSAVYLEPNTDINYSHGNIVGGLFAVGQGYSSAGTGIQTVTNAIGIQAGLQKNGGSGQTVFTNWASFYAPVDTGWVGSGTFTITNARGMWIDDQTRGTNNTNLLIGSGTTGDWSIYNNSTKNNYFAGNLGIGTQTPNSLLEVGNTGYFQFSKTSAGAPLSTDCDSDAEIGRLSISTGFNRLYICNGAARGWDYITLTN